MRKIGIWAILILIALMSVSIVEAEEQTSAQTNPGINWNGTWHSLLFNLTFIQNGDKVTGTYSALNPNSSIAGILEGTLSSDEKELSGSWQEIGNFIFTRSEDKTSFSSNLGYNGTTENYIGNSSDWTGDWKSDTYSLNLHQNGMNISGTIQNFDTNSSETGVVAGILSDDEKIVSGTWTESGTFYYNLSNNGSFFNGTFTFDNQVSRPDDTWNGTRIE